MMSSKNNHFTASDIERYHSGKLSSKERHALEKAALDDPFLADALEGYAYTTTAPGDLEKITQRLHQKLQTKKTIPFFQQYRWLSAAAVVIILAGAGWFAYSSFKNQKNSLASNVPAQEEKKEGGPTIHSSSNKNADTVTANQPAVSVDKSVETNNSPQKEQTPASTKKSSPKNTTEAIAAGKVAGTKISSAGQGPQINLGKPAERPTAFRAAAIKPANDTINTAGAKNAVASDIKARGVTADTIKSFNVTLQSKQPQMEEVVVGNGVRKKAVPKYPKVSIDTLEPTEGYDEFDDYIAEHVKLPEEIKTKSISGEIQLSFDVDEEGKPTNISVVKSLCNKCDEEAIRLLKEGPKWKKKKNKKGKLTIRF